LLAHLFRKTIWKNTKTDGLIEQLQ